MKEGEENHEGSSLPVPGDAGFSGFADSNLESLWLLTNHSRKLPANPALRRAALNLMEDALISEAAAKRAVEERQKSDAALEATERTLRLREAELAKVQSIGGVGTIDITLVDGLSGPRSPQYRRLHGLPPAQVSETHAQWLERVHPEDRDKAEHAFRIAIEGDGNIYESDYRIIRPVDGETRWILAKADIERDRKGRAVRIVGAHMDVTDRMSAEAALVRSRAKLEAFFSRAEVGISELSETGRILRANDTLCRILGRSHQELLGLSCTDFTHPDDQDHTSSVIKSLLDTGEPVSLDRRYVRPDGTVLYANSALSRLEGDGADPPTVLAVTADLTARRLAEEALRENESKLRTLFESMGEAFVLQEAILDPAGNVVDYRFLESNPAFTRQTGLADPRGRTAKEMIPDLDPVWHTCSTRVLETGEPARFETWIPSLAKWLSVSAARFGGAGSRKVAIVFNDVSRRKEAEEALRSSREYLELVLESATSYAIITLDAEGIVTGWNSGASSILGFGQEEMIGGTLDIIFTPEDQAAGIHEREMRIARDYGRAPDERWHQRKDGTRCWLSGTMSPLLREGTVTGYVKVARDLTRQRQAENALRESESRFRTLSDAVPQLVWNCDGDGEAVYFNRRWYDYTGLAFEESRDRGWLAAIHPDDQPPFTSSWLQAVAAGRDLEAEFRLRGVDGTFSWFIGRMVTLRDESGYLLGWFGTATDISRLKETEQALQSARHELESRVEERTRELSEALARLRIEAEERERLEEDRRGLLKRIVSLQEEERARISRELHDNLGQHMVAVKFGLDSLSSSLVLHEASDAAQDIGYLRKVVDALIESAHRQAWELRPLELDHLGLQVALENCANDWSEITDIPVTLECTGLAENRLPPEIEIVFYRVTQEALTNVARHSQATEVQVLLHAGQPTVLEIRDNGKGFDARAAPGRLGLVGMKERLLLVGGQLEISSSGQGTTIRAVIDLPENEAPHTES